MRHGTSNPGQAPARFRSVRLHPAYRNKTRPTPEEARESRAKRITIPKDGTTLLSHHRRWKPDYPVPAYIERLIEQEARGE